MKMVSPLRHSSTWPWSGLLALAWLLTATPVQSQDTAASRMQQEARRLAESGDVAGALDSYRLLVQQFRDDELAPGSLLEVARLERLQGRTAETRTAISQLTERYPRSAAAAEGFWLLADLAAQTATSLGGLEEARTTFRRIPLLYGRDAYPLLPARVAAYVRSAELALMLGDLAAAQGDLLAAIEEEPATPWTARARTLLARTLLPEDWIAAAEILQQVADHAEEGEGDEARRLLSLIHRRMVRPRAGNPWGPVARFPPSGLALREPIGVAANRKGEVLVVDGKDDAVAFLGEDGSVLARRTLEDSGRPGFTPSGEPYVVRDGGADLVFSGQREAFADPDGRGGQLKSPLAAIRGPAGSWFVAAKGYRSLVVYEGETGRARADLLEDRRPEPEDLASDDQGRIYILDREGNQVIRLSTEGRFLGIAARGEWRKPVAVAVDALGFIYVLDRGAGRVEIFDAGGRPVTAIGPQIGGAVELRDPVDLAVDGAGRILVADRKLPFLVLFE